MTVFIEDRGDLLEHFGGFCGGELFDGFEDAVGVGDDRREEGVGRGGCSLGFSLFFAEFVSLEGEQSGERLGLVEEVIGAAPGFEKVAVFGVCGEGFGEQLVDFAVAGHGEAACDADAGGQCARCGEVFGFDVVADAAGAAASGLDIFADLILQNGLFALRLGALGVFNVGGRREGGDAGDVSQEDVNGVAGFWKLFFQPRGVSGKDWGEFARDADQVSDCHAGVEVEQRVHVRGLRARGEG